MIAVTGAGGKSTLIRCINRLETPTEGRIWIGEHEMTSAEGAELRRLRTEIGMIFQQFNLVKRHTVLTNVLSGSLGQTSLASSLFLRFSDEERARLEIDASYFAEIYVMQALSGG